MRLDASADCVTEQKSPARGHSLDSVGRSDRLQVSLAINPWRGREMLDGIPLISGAGGSTGPLPSSYSPRYLGNFPAPSATFVVN